VTAGTAPVAVGPTPAARPRPSRRRPAPRRTTRPGGRPSRRRPASSGSRRSP
jgi:hypothetical protein